jgi:hypothetical protein
MTGILQVLSFLSLILDWIKKYGVPAGQSIKDAFGVPEEEVDPRIDALPDKLTPFEEYFKEG